MATSFSNLPIIDLSILSSKQTLPQSALSALSQQLYNVFATTGFAYLINAPLTFSHGEVFDLAKQFFSMPMSQKLTVAKKDFVPQNTNTYRGYFPPQPGHPLDLGGEESRYRYPYVAYNTT